jgi:hypothetical protein
VFDLERMVEPMSVRYCLLAVIAREGACNFLACVLRLRQEKTWTFNII